MTTFVTVSRGGAGGGGQGRGGFPIFVIPEALSGGPGGDTDEGVFLHLPDPDFSGLLTREEKGNLRIMVHLLLLSTYRTAV